MTKSLFHVLATHYDQQQDKIGIVEKKEIRTSTGDTQYMTLMLRPICHTDIKTQIEVTIDAEQKRILRVEPKEQFIIAPVNDGARQSITPHYLHDKIEYIVPNASTAFGHLLNEKEQAKTKTKYNAYLTQLEKWVAYAKANGYAYKKIEALHYVLTHEDVLTHLIQQGCVSVNEQNELIDKAQLAHVVYVNIIDPSDIDDVAIEADKRYHESAIAFITSIPRTMGVCHITGQQTAVMTTHPSKVRHVADGTKLVSEPSDDNLYTSAKLGKQKEDSFAVDYMLAQKAYAMLDYYRQQNKREINGRTYIMWAEDGATDTHIIAPIEQMGIFSAFIEESVKEDSRASNQQLIQHLLQTTTGTLTKDIPNQGFYLLVLDGATDTKGRLAVLDYRYIRTHDYIKMFKQWATRNAVQTYNRVNKCMQIQSLSPLQCVKRLHSEYEASRYNQTFMQIMRSIQEGRPLPKQILQHAANQTHPYRYETHAQWQTALQTYMHIYHYNMRCLHSHIHPFSKEEHDMYENKNDLSYLYGRLTAIAEHIESRAMYEQKKEARTTNAEKQFYAMQVRPVQTWQLIYNHLIKSYLPKLPQGLKVHYTRQIDEIMSRMTPHTGRKLDGDFIVGYSHQRQALWQKQETTNTPEQEEQTHA